MARGFSFALVFPNRIPRPYVSTIDAALKPYSHTPVVNPMVWMGIGGCSAIFVVAMREAGTCV